MWFKNKQKEQKKIIEYEIIIVFRNKDSLIIGNSSLEKIRVVFKKIKETKGLFVRKDCFFNKKDVLYCYHRESEVLG